MSRRPASREHGAGRGPRRAAGSFSLRQILDIARSLSLPAALGRLAYPLRRRWCEARCCPDETTPRSLAGTVRALLQRPEPPAPDRPLGRLSRA